MANIRCTDCGTQINPVANTHRCSPIVSTTLNFIPYQPNNYTTMTGYVGEQKESIPVRETEMNKVIGSLRNSVERSESHIEQLGIRLCNIMRGGIAQSQDKVATPKYSVPLAQELDSIISRLEKVNEQIMELTSRVEL